MNPRGRRFASGLCVLVLLLSCSNNPYPNADSEQKILYTYYPEAPRTMDPAISYTTNSHQVIANVYETLLEYHYLKRPYELIPGLAKTIPVARELSDGRVAYRFEIRPGMLYQDDPAFSLSGEGRATREIVANDFVFELLRISDPALNSPVQHVFSKIVGLREFAVRLTERREQDEAFAKWKAREQYEAAGPVDGIRILGEHSFEIVLDAPYPQMLYWFAMPFTTAVPWEAVHYYDGNEGRARFADHPVGMGPYRITQYDKQFRIVLEANPNWYGVMHPEWKAPGTLYPSEGEPGDVALGRLGPGISGRALPIIERIEFRREKESIPRFNKFLQGFYDKSVIIKESFDSVIQADRLSPDMLEKGVKLDKTVELGVFYIGFNQEDPLFGKDNPERGRKLRQAMSLAIDAQEFIDLFLNGIGVPAQTPLPPGLFGQDPEYENPFREVDLARAKQILLEAGYPGGIDSETGKPLKLTFDTYSTTSAQMIRIQYLVDSWRKIGLDVEIAPSTYNQFQEKVKKNLHQIYMWGWIADYPDPENFLFLLTSVMAEGDGPNHSNFKNERYDALFARMKSRANDAVRFEVIAEMIKLLEHERPWIELFHGERYALYHGWVTQYKRPGFVYPTTKYQDIDAELRAMRRAEWNQPVLWPAFALVLTLLAIVIPGIRTLIRERQ